MTLYAAKYTQIQTFWIVEIIQNNLIALFIDRSQVSLFLFT